MHTHPLKRFTMLSVSTLSFPWMHAFFVIPEYLYQVSCNPEKIFQ